MVVVVVVVGIAVPALPITFIYTGIVTVSFE